MSTPVGVHKESYYQAKIIKWLREAYPQAFVWKAQQGPYSRQGIPDICAIIDGHFFGFEVKRPEGGELSPFQAHQRRRRHGPRGQLPGPGAGGDREMADGTQQNPLRDMITALGSLSEMAHIFYTGMKGAGASEQEAISGMNTFIAAMWHESMEDAREKRRRDEQKETE